MTKSGKTLLTLILTYGIRKFGFWYFNVHPISGMTDYSGMAVDLALWIVLFKGIAWVLDSVVPTVEKGSEIKQ